MFSVGDKIVYPMHGAGIIQRIEEKKILGESREYYILKLSCNEMQVMIPVSSGESVGIRDIVGSDVIKVVLSLLREESSDMSSNWNRRYRENMDKLRTGDILQVAEVVRNLTRLDRTKKLSAGEKKLLNNAMDILVSEIILVEGLDAETAERLIEESV